MQTLVDVYLSYNPPAGVLGDVGEKLGAGSRFEKALQQDLDNFARMVDQAPTGALDPQSSSYLFHSGSAAAQGKTTDRQNASMGHESNPRTGTTATGDYTTTTGTPVDRPVLDQDIINEPSGTTRNQSDVLGRPDKGASADPTRPADQTEGFDTMRPPDRDNKPGY